MMKKTAITSAIMLLSALILPLIFSSIQTGKAEAEMPHYDIYVNASRPNDLGNGLSWATAKQLIQSGVDNVTEGGTVHVAAGTYNENVHLGRSLNLSGAGALSTVIDGGHTGQVINISSYLGQANTISGFTIRNGHINWGGSGVEPGLVLFAPPGMPVGGGVYVSLGHTVIMNDCAIVDNRAEFMGGGVYSAGNLTLNRCTVSGNTARYYGGGIANFVDEPTSEQPSLEFVPAISGRMALVNCTISGNSVTQSLPPVEVPTVATNGPELILGGGVLNGGIASFTNVTISNNSVPMLPEAHGGGFANVPLQCINNSSGDNNELLQLPATATFKNTLVSGNVPDNGYSYLGTVTSQGYNLDSQNSCGFNQSTDLHNTDPQIGSLQNNGGPTSTHSIAVSSPALNSGTATGAPATDQRGIARPQGDRYDIGAYESVPQPEPIAPNPLIGTGGQSSNPGLAVGTFSNNPPVTNPIIITQSASLSARTVTPGTPVTVTVDIANKSAVNGSKKVVLYVNGQVETTQGIAVGSGGTTKLTFNVSRSEPGDYSVYVDGTPAGSFKVELVRESDAILILSATLVALAFLVGMVMLWRRQRNPQ